MYQKYAHWGWHVLLQSGFDPACFAVMRSYLFVLEKEPTGVKRSKVQPLVPIPLRKFMSHNHISLVNSLSVKNQRKYRLD
jgi:hypothetical protein